MITYFVRCPNCGATANVPESAYNCCCGHVTIVPVQRWYSRWGDLLAWAIRLVLRRKPSASCGCRRRQTRTNLFAAWLIGHATGLLKEDDMKSILKMLLCVAVGFAIAEFAPGQDTSQLLPIDSHVQPAAGMSLPCQVLEIYDGDTVTVELRIPLRVRLLDCWAPELRDEGGDASRRSLVELAGGRRGLLEIPLDGVHRLDGVLTFGRVLGRLWIGGRDVSAVQVSRGHATLTKQR